MKFMLIISALLLAAVALPQISSLFKWGGERFANSLLVNTTKMGLKTYLSDVAINARWLLVVGGSDSNHVNIAGAGSQPIGVCRDQIPPEDIASGDLSYPLGIILFGLNPDTVRVIAAAAIAEWALLVPAANGQVQTLPVAAGTYWVIGRAASAAAAAGDQVELIHTLPYKVVVA